ncbi:MAG: NAD/NADP octopine/nopaline dehydrogenase family protein [Culicoidibacterales bacterium]
MDITIVGFGNGGSAMAADLKAKGHHITVLKTSKLGEVEHFLQTRDNDGLLTLYAPEGKVVVNLDLVTDDYAQALTKTTQAVVLFVPTTYHEQILLKMLPYLHDGQIILLEPGYLGTTFFLKHAPLLDLTIVEAESSPLDCRITNPAEVTVSFKNICNPVGVYPRARGLQTLEKLADWGYNFRLLDSVIEAALQNPNLIVHTVGGIMSIPRIDFSGGEYWMYKEVFSPAIWSLVESLDAEKISVLTALGLPGKSYLEACKLRNTALDSMVDAKAIFDHYAQFDSIKGPLVSNSRYIMEDVPQGLVLLESLGAYFKVPTPTCTSLITIAGNCMSTDFRIKGRTLESLGLTYIQQIITDK